MRYTPKPADQARVDNDFVFHPPLPGGDQGERYSEIREAGRMLASRLLMLCPPSRELSLALTNLDQVVFWANAAIARNETPSTVKEHPPA